jgi:hypothetical protein
VPNSPSPLRSEPAGLAVLCPFRVTLNRRLGKAREHAERWCRGRLAAGSPALQARLIESADLAAGYYPHADERALCLGTDVLAWLFALTDLLDETPFGGDPAAVDELLRELERVLGGSRPALPLSSALGEVVARIGDLAGPDPQARAVAALHGTFEGLRWQTSLRAGARPPDETTFRRMRPLAGAVPVRLALVEPLEQATLSAALRDHPTMTALHTLASAIVGELEDILAWPARAHRAARSLVAVLAHARRLPADAALAAAVRMTNEHVRDYVILEAQHLPPTADQRPLDAYLAALRSIMATTAAWSLET